MLLRVLAPLAALFPAHRIKFAGRTAFKFYVACAVLLNSVPFSIFDF